MNNGNWTEGGHTFQPTGKQRKALSALAGFGLVSLSVMLCGFGATVFAETKKLPSSQPEVPVLKLSLRDAMDASVDQNPTVRLFQERIHQAQDVADTQLGALLPNLSGSLSGSRRRFFTGSFGGSPTVTDPRDFYEARAALTSKCV